MNFNKGDKVLCISDENEINGWLIFCPNFLNIPKIGRIYTVRDYFLNNTKTSYALRLEEIICPIHFSSGVECGWNISRFKKIDFNNYKIKLNKKHYHTTKQ